MAETSLKEIIRALPPELRDEVRDFAAFLLTRQSKKSKPKPAARTKMNFEWQGALKGIQYTSVELQHRIADMRAGQDETTA